LEVSLKVGNFHERQSDPFTTAEISSKSSKIQLKNHFNLPLMSAFAPSIQFIPESSVIFAKMCFFA
jgi:hypothetical protein